MARVHLPDDYSRDLPKPIIGWIVNHACRNFWRVADWYEIDDLVQDGILCAYKCRAKYGVPGKDIDPPHFMALVKTAFYRHIGDLLRRSRAEQAVCDRIGDIALREQTDTDFLDRCAAPVDGLQEFVAFVAKMPETLRCAIGAYLSPIKDGETESQRLKRLASFPLRFDFETELRAYFWEAEHV